MFRTPDHPSKLEGIAGKAWGANSKAYEVFDLPDLSGMGNAKGAPLVEEKDPHINGERIAKEFRDLWKRSLRHMVAEL